MKSMDKNKSLSKNKLWTEIKKLLIRTLKQGRGIPWLHALVVYSVEPTEEESPESGRERIQIRLDQKILFLH